MEMKFYSQQGVTLIEMMVALVLGLFVAAAVITVFITTVSSNAAAMRMIKLNQELRSTMILMTRDIRRAGYWSDTTSNSPYLDDIEIVGGSCLLMAYDDPSGNDYIGYKLDGGVIKRANANAAFTCATGTWVELTDPDTINIANLDFNMSVRIIGQDTTICGGGDCSVDLSDPASELSVYKDTGALFSGYITEISVTATGANKSDTSLERTVSDTIRVRNNGLNL